MNPVIHDFRVPAKNARKFENCLQGLHDLFWVDPVEYYRKGKEGHLWWATYDYTVIITAEFSAESEVAMEFLVNSSYIHSYWKFKQ